MGNMIGNVSLWRIEPCFMSKKNTCGEVSRVKKDSQNNQNIQNSNVKTEGVDTFTSSQHNEKNISKVNKSNTPKK